jgi:hypothetical protein
VQLSAWLSCSLQINKLVLLLQEDVIGLKKLSRNKEVDPAKDRN